MARTVFFSFDYDDVFKVNQVRNSGQFQGVKKSGFKDKAEYEKIKLSGDRAIERWILAQMKGCSVTCVLIGRNTHLSKWVNYEIEASISQGMGLLGIYIHHLNNPIGLNDDGIFDPPNPLDRHHIVEQGLFRPRTVCASDKYSTYTWSKNAGGLLGYYLNTLGTWIDEAAKTAGR